MFWIGFCAGVSAAFLVLIAGISAIGWGVGKERSNAAKYQESMVKYWQRSMDNQATQIAVLENIEMSIRNK